MTNEHKATLSDDTIVSSGIVFRGIVFSGIVSSAIDLGPSRNFSLPMRLRLLQKSSWQDGDLQLVAAALVGEIAKAPGMSSIARPVGLGRERLYKFLSFSRDSELATLLKVISALGLPMDVRIKRNAKLAV